MGYDRIERYTCDAMGCDAVQRVLAENIGFDEPVPVGWKLNVEGEFVLCPACVVRFDEMRKAFFKS